ncbi:HNH endonuclease signature motif containing protein [Sporosarcina sp. E16_8]|uniref:HNH endonuclease signature motif containing protein n=1 Tax=Sporosarcina sp. E16_8 TaxID=2789295 RepID=UPI0031F8322A
MTHLTPHRYSQAHCDFIAKNIPGRSRKEMTEMFNTHFELELGVNQITAFIKNRGLSNGLDTRFKLGQVAFNKGKSIGGWEPTQFKKGNRPHNHKPVGTERVNGDDYVDIKIEEPNVWEAKHRVIWKKKYGPIPKGHVVIFGDGNRRNFENNNLILVSRRILSILNGRSLIQNDADLTRTGIIVANISSKMSDRKNG